MWKQVPHDEAVAELRAITTDPHLLAHGTTRANHDRHAEHRALLEAAGADMDELAAEMVHATTPLYGIADGLNAARKCDRGAR